MFPTEAWEILPTFAGKKSQSSLLEPGFSQFSAIGMLLDYHLTSAPQTKSGREKESSMSSQSQFTRTLAAMAAALVMSTVAVSAAVGPAQANANPVKVTRNA